MNRISMMAVIFAGGLAGGHAAAQTFEFEGVPTPAEILEILAPEAMPADGFRRAGRSETPRRIVLLPPPTTDRHPQPATPQGREPQAAAPRPNPQPAISFATNFAIGSADLPSGLMPVLRAYGHALQLAPALRLEISGHTDVTGPAAVNEALSLQRADAARRFIQAEFGIDQSRIVPRGAGPREMRGDYPPDAAQQRRIEIRRLQ
ncbi:OmpA family protein [Falsiroseomonas stagni]|uniref:OmpA family protein n=1 Tax=Falsiroseomonas stagni DSM 19981 TaxID=1123062 RepID=A0A1I4F8E3_9PROT|nr:OmpA family protein [Falsiroseomonas stagni]SFL13117.1 OmpA family protein [Falsiroseomonas stagni DSM 19981]